MNNSGPAGAMSVGDFAKWAGIGRTLAWKQIKDNRLQAIKVGKRTLVPFANAAEWLSNQQPAQRGGH